MISIKRDDMCRESDRDPRVLPLLREWVGVGPDEVSDEELLAATEGTILHCFADLHLEAADHGHELVIEVEGVKLSAQWLAERRAQRRGQ